jgi:hypothetical protein
VGCARATRATCFACTHCSASCSYVFLVSRCPSLLYYHGKIKDRELVSGSVLRKQYRVRIIPSEPGLLRECTDHVGLTGELEFHFWHLPHRAWTMGRDGSVGIVTCYGLGGPGIESRWGASLSSSVQTVSGAHPETVPDLFPLGTAAGAWR